MAYLNRLPVDHLFLYNFSFSLHRLLTVCCTDSGSQKSQRRYFDFIIYHVIDTLFTQISFTQVEIIRSKIMTQLTLFYCRVFLQRSPVHVTYPIFTIPYGHMLGSTGRGTSVSPSHTKHWPKVMIRASERSL